MSTHNNVWLGSFSAVLGIVAATLLAACDTSTLQSGIEGTGITDTTTAAVSSGRIDRVDGLGVAVNGVSWSAAKSETVIDGAIGNPAELKPGMIATVQGERATSDKGTANVIRTQFLVRGPIREINGALYRLNVLGQTIVVDRRTNLDVPGAALDLLAVGQVVTVSGFVTADREVRATLLTIPTATDARNWVVNGTVTAVDRRIGRLAINGLDVVYSSAVIQDVPATATEVGQSVTVSGLALTADGALVATRIAAYDASLPATTGETVLSGVIARIESDGVAFWNQRIVLLPGAARESLSVGSYIRATGTMVGGVLYASDVITVGSGPLFVFLVGYVDAVNTTARTLTMFGIEFTVSDTVQLSHVSVGDRVRVLAYRNRFISDVQSASGLPYAAERQVLIEGELEALSPPTQLTLRGPTAWVVQVSPDTLFGYDWIAGKDECYMNVVSAERFWALAALPKQPGFTTVWAWGRFEGGILLATSTGICFPSAP